MESKATQQSRSSGVLTISNPTLAPEKHQRELLQHYMRMCSMLKKFRRIISYMTKQSLPAVSTLTPETIEEFKTADKVVLIGYFAADDKASNTTFNAAADSMRDDYLFGATNDATLAQAEGVKQPSIVLYKD